MMRSLPGRSRSIEFLVQACAGVDGLLAVEQIGQNHFRADVAGLKRLELFVGFYGGRDRHEAVQASGIVASVIVLSAAVHRASQ